MDRYRVGRNLLIVAALAAAVDFIPQGGRAANTVASILVVAFGVGMALFAGRMYLEHRVAIHSLEDRDRALLYGAVAVGAVAICAQKRMFETGAGEFAWFVLIGLVAVSLYNVYRRWRAY